MSRGLGKGSGGPRSPRGGHASIQGHGPATEAGRRLRRHGLRIPIAHSLTTPPHTVGEGTPPFPSSCRFSESAVYFTPNTLPDTRLLSLSKKTKLELDISKYSKSEQVCCIILEYVISK